jgi:type IV pilus assembly protein PilM
MAKRLSSVLGVDIGSKKIKVAEVRNQGREAVVTALGMIDTPEGAVDHTGVYNSDAVGAALKQAVGEAGASVSHVVVSIAGQASVLVRTLEVPKMNATELKEHMQWEINRNIPFSESTVVSDFRPLGDDDPNSQNMDVVMAISPQSAVDTLIACVKKAGRQMAAIDVEPLGLARSLKMSHDDEYAGQTVCLVDVGHKTTSINIYQEGKLLMPRQVPIGGEMFTKAIADAQGISMDEAEALKLAEADLSGASGAAAAAATQAFTPYNPFAEDAPPAPAPEGEGEAVAEATVEETVMTPAPVPVPAGNGAVSSSLAPVLDEFVAEIRRSLDYFRSRGGDVNRLALCGGGGRLRGLASFLTTNVGVPCDNYDPLRRLNLNAKKIAPGFVEDHRGEFAVAVGNGLHIFFD